MTPCVMSMCSVEIWQRNFVSVAHVNVFILTVFVHLAPSHLNAVLVCARCALLAPWKHVVKALSVIIDRNTQTFAIGHILCSKCNRNRYPGNMSPKISRGYRGASIIKTFQMFPNSYFSS